MGTVYLARDPDLNRAVAIKVLRDALFDEELLQRFLREARAAANLRHENLITIYDVGQHDHQPFMAMEYVDGKSLAEVIAERQPLTLGEKLFYIEQICAGLHYAHCAGIVHRDIKPANLMVDRQGVIRILDFGIARIEGSGMTSDGAMMGTLNYMSPEQMLGRPVDYRSDIFAIGAVAYELLSYQQAFGGTLDDGLLQRLPHEDPTPLVDLCPGMPGSLEPIVMRALAKRPEDRFANLEETRVAVREVRRSVDPQLEIELVATRQRGGSPDAKGAQTPGSPPARRELLERRARQIAIHRDAARAALAREDLDSATAACEDSLTLDPDDPEALKLLAEIQQTKLRRDQESKERHDRERTIRQRLADAEVKLSRGDIAGAAAQLQQALALDPRAPEALALLPRVKEAAAAAAVTLPDLLTSDLDRTIVINRRLGVRADAIAAGIGSLAWTRRPILLASGIIGIGAAIVIAILWLTPREGPSSSAEPKAAAVAQASPSAAAPAPVVAVGSASNSPAPASPTATNISEGFLQEQLDRITATYRNGDLGAALVLITPVLATTTDNRVRGLARTIAQSAQHSMTAAANAATNRKAPELAPGTLALAEQSRVLAERALGRNDFVEAGTQALLAAASYARAEREAMAATPTAVPLPQIPPAAAPSVAANTSVNSGPANSPASSTTSGVVPAAAPNAAVAAPAFTPSNALDRERAGILQALTRYQSAYRERSIQSLLAVYPSIPRETRQKLEKTFTRDCRDYDVTFGNMQPALNDDPTYATVTVRTTYSCQPKGAQAAQQASVQELFVLRKLGDAWLIESAGTMDAPRPR